MEASIESISEQYQVRLLNREQINEIHELYLGNPLYFHHIHVDNVTADQVMDDLTALPPGKESRDKYFMGFYWKDQLAAVMDLIDGYPDDATAYIGLFMMNAEFQGRGMGSEIVEQVCAFLKKQGFAHVRLGYVKGNPQSRQFWIKNRFLPVGRETEMEEGYTAVVMQRELADKSHNHLSFDIKPTQTA